MQTYYRLSGRERKLEGQLIRSGRYGEVLEVTDPEKLEQYRDSVLTTVEHYGGRYLTVGGRCDVVEGEWRPVFPVLIEFPSLEQAHRWYDAEEYRDLKELRLAATRGNAVFIEGNEFRR